MQFPVKWQYLKGAENVADALSRLPEFYLAVLLRSSAKVPQEPLVPKISQVTSGLPLFPLLDAIRNGYAKDQFFHSTVDLIEADGLFFQSDRICVPNVPEVKQVILQACHDSQFAGHMGMKKTLEMVGRLFWWPILRSDVEKYVKECRICQTAKSGKARSQGLLQPLSVPERPWWCISVDFITGLPLTPSGHDAILTVTDRLTRLVHLIPTTTKCNATEFAALLRDHVISKHGCPGDIVSDRGAIFTGKFWSAVCSALHIHLSKSTAFHPQSDGVPEAVNKMVEQVLRCHCMTAQEEWSEHLSMVEFALNNSQHSSLAKSPFLLNFGMHPVTPVLLETLKLSKVPSAFKWTQDMQQALQNAKSALQAAKDRQKAYADTRRVEVSFQVGAQVL